MSGHPSNHSGGPPSRREPLLDLLRGFFLVLMTIDHLDGVGARFGFEAFGFVAAAEGFVVLSGFVSARVYGRMLHREPSRLRRTILERAALLYVSHLLLVVFVVAITLGREVPPSSTDPYFRFAVQPLAYTFKAAVFVFQPYLLDVLPMYVLFVGGLPWLLRAIRRNAVLTMLVSTGVWTLSLGLHTQDWIEGSGLFVFPSWQLLFVGGAVLGSYPLECHFGKVRGRVLVWIAALTVLLGLGLKHGDAAWAFGAHLQWWIQRPKLGPIRLVTIMAYLVLVAWGRRGRLGRIRSVWLEFLGRHSLHVFVWHFPVVLLCKPQRFVQWLSASWGGDLPPYVVQATDLAITALAVASLTIAAAAHERWRGSSVARRLSAPVAPAS